MSIVSIDFSQKLEKIRPLHGVNNGPRVRGFRLDTSDAYREAGIPYVRLHDTEYEYGSGLFVDIHCIFPDFGADPDDPDAYRFTMTDEYIKAIRDAGAEPFYRLGVSIEHSPMKKYIYPPADNQKWARICEHIIRHYNEGWDHGYHYAIRYWEIWNEPEDVYGLCTSMWMGCPEQYYELYTVTAKHLKSCFGDAIKVGGYAACGHHAPFDAPDAVDDYNCRYTEDFLRYVKDHDAPLDFYSWHLYSHGPDVNDFRAVAAWSRDALRRAGMDHVESICDEWNFGHSADIFRMMKTEAGAAAYAAAMTLFQEEDVSLATYYDGQADSIYCGLFDRLTQKPTKSYYAFKAWNELFRLGNRVKTLTFANGHYACAAANGDEAAILFSAFGAEPGSATFEIDGFSGENGITVEGYAVTEGDAILSPLPVEMLTGYRFKLVEKIGKNTMILLKLRKR